MESQSEIFITKVAKASVLSKSFPTKIYTCELLQTQKVYVHHCERLCFECIISKHQVQSLVLKLDGLKSSNNDQYEYNCVPI